MLSNEITAVAGADKKRKRIGRGKGSGHGKTAGRGHKGAHSRAGFASKLAFEGGQMPLFRRLPKRGFNNVNFATKYDVVNICELDRVFNDGTVITVEMLFEAGLVGSRKSMVKVLGNGELTKKLEVSAHKFSKSAEQKIADCGGTVNVVA